MSTDIQVISLVNDLQILKVAEIANATPRALRVQGRNGFNTAQRVVINDYGIDTFTIVTDQVILINPPSLFDGVTPAQMKIFIVSGQYTGIGRARLSFGSTLQVRRVSGIQKLVQQVVKTLLSNVRSNKFDLGDGGDLVRSLGDNLSPAGKSKVGALVATAVSNTEAQVVASQSGALGLSAAERLLSFTLESISFQQDAGEVEATLSLLSYAGRAVSFPLTL